MIFFPRRGELEQRFDKAKLELETLNEQRSEQVKVTESIVRQRDLYRVLLAQATGVSFPQQGNRLVYHMDTAHLAASSNLMLAFSRCTTRGVHPDLHPPVLTCSHSHRGNAHFPRVHGEGVFRSLGGQGGFATGEKTIEIRQNKCINLGHATVGTSCSYEDSEVICIHGYFLGAWLICFPCLPLGGDVAILTDRRLLNQN